MTGISSMGMDVLILVKLNQYLNVRDKQLEHNVTEYQPHAKTKILVMEQEVVLTMDTNLDHLFVIQAHNVLIQIHVLAHLVAAPL